jgi:hypothetical protein
MIHDVKVYTDIGHLDERDLLWAVCGGVVETAPNLREDTHLKHWGEEIQNCWRGRFERNTGFCSILGPAGTQHVSPLALRQMLVDAFPVTRFYFFADGIGHSPFNFSPNPKVI